MKREHQDIEQLERYQRGECNIQEKQEVENRLAEDSEFRGLYDDMELMVLGLRRTSEGSSIEDKIELLKRAVEVFDEEEEGKVVDARSWFSKARVNLSIAAVISLLIVSVFVFNNTGSSSPEMLFENYFQPYENLNSPLRDAQQEVDDLTMAYMAYEQGNYDEAAKYFELANSKNTELLTHLFYQGNAYLAIGEPEKAISLFKIVAESTSILKDTAKWYLALSYLRAKDIEKCQQLLKEISLTNNGYSKQSEDILKQLN